MQTLLVIAGGSSDEHEISIISARSLCEALDGSAITADVQVVGRDGRWLTPEEGQAALVAGRADTGGLSIYQALPRLERFEVVFPLIHGQMGEDGKLQGLLEYLQLPYVGSGVLGSALAMDKGAAKDVLAQHGVSQTRWLTLSPDDLRDPQATIQRITAELSGPWFIKPCNQGSSVGITKAKDEAALLGGIKTAFEFDRRVVVEEAVEQPRELEIGIIGNTTVETSCVGEITYDADFYSYEAKYTEGRSAMHIPADLPEGVAEEIIAQSQLAYRALDCNGFARIDFLFEPSTSKIYLSEVNTLPGFTPFSMFTKLWESSGLNYEQTVAKLVALALE